MALRRLRRIEEKIKDAKDAADILRNYITIQVEEEPSRDELFSIFRRETEERLSRIPVTIIPTDSVRLADVLELSRWRKPPFSKADDPTGFHDAVIILAVLKYAQANRLRECIFVSTDKDHVESSIRKLGNESGVTGRLVQGTDRIIEIMENLHTAHVRSLADSSIRRVTEFMNAHRGEVQRFLDEHPLKLGDFGFSYGISPPEVVSVTVGEIEAFPDGSPTHDGPYAITFYADVVGKFLVSNVMLETPRFDHLEARPSTESEGRREGNPLGLLLSRGLVGETLPTPTVTPSLQSVEVRLKGKAKGFLNEGRFVGPPEIEALEVWSNPYSKLRPGQSRR